MTISTEEAHAQSLPSLDQVMRSPALSIATWFGSGLSPAAPGTAGSVAALPFVLLLLIYGSLTSTVIVGVLVLIVGTWASRQAGRQWGQVDHGAIVIDEVLGQLIALALPFYLVGGQESLLFLSVAGCALFRVFDITKMWPASYFDSRVKNALGVMLDDVVAGTWAGSCCCALLTVF